MRSFLVIGDSERNKAAKYLKNLRDDGPKRHFDNVGETAEEAVLSANVIRFTTLPDANRLSLAKERRVRSYRVSLDNEQ